MSMFGATDYKLNFGLTQWGLWITRVFEHRNCETLNVWFPRLAYGTPEERGHFIVFRDSLHWPDLDEDIGLPTLLLGRGLGESPQSLQHWLEERQKGREPASTSA